MADSRPYEFVPVATDPQSLSSYIDLFVSSFGSTKMTPEFLDWQYNQNPNGKVVGCNAFLKGELAAHYVTIPVEARLSGVLTRGLLSINTATHPDHQRQGLFPKLAELTYARGRELGHEFVVGVANPNSLYGFLNKLGFQRVTELEARLVMSVRTNEPREPLDYISEWSTEAVSWRTSNPRYCYWAKKRDGKAQIFTRTKHLSVLFGQVADDRVPDLPTRTDLMPLKVWLGVDSRVKWGLLQPKIPRPFRPSPLTLIFRDLIGHRQIDPHSTAFWAMDFDAF